MSSSYENSKQLALPTRENIRLYVPPADLLGVMRGFIKEPAAAWQSVFSSREEWQKLFERYVFFLAAIPAVSRFIGQVLFSGAPFFRSLTYAIIAYLLSVAFLFAATYFAHRSVAMFDGRLSMHMAAQLIVYSLMPFFLCGIFLAVPDLSVFAIAGFYSFYLFYTGVQQIAGIPAQKQMLFFMVNVVSWLVCVGLIFDAL